MISAVLVTFNEAKNIVDCLESIKEFVTEIIVFDLDSSDNIEDVAKKYGAKFYKQKKADYVELVRNEAISKTRGEWVLVLDPDERLPKTLIDELKKVVKENKYSAVNIPRKNIFFGSWISHTNFWPDRHIRFFKKTVVNWPKIIHVYPKINGEILSLPAKEDLAITHFGYKSYWEFIKRQQRYSSVDAKNRYERGIRFSLLNLFWRPSREFLARFVKHQGYLDGKNGIFIVAVLMYYQFLMEFKLIKLQK